MKTWVFLGVDQTGAIDKNGIPKPLPCCVIRGDTVEFFYITDFSKKEMYKHIQPTKNEELLVCVDCVLGLPEPLKMTWRQALQRIRKFKGYGMKIAKDYFFEIGQGKIERRKIEIKCQANSVFKEKPFQKNIQTGSYRIWKDISLNDDFVAPAVEMSPFENKIRIYEGYPSFSWRLLFKTPNRLPQNLSDLLEISFPKLEWTKAHQKSVQQDPNLADALVLALTMKEFKSAAFALNPEREGWILGVV